MRRVVPSPEENNDKWTRATTEKVTVVKEASLFQVSNHQRSNYEGEEQRDCRYVATKEHQYAIPCIQGTKWKSSKAR